MASVKYYDRETKLAYVEQIVSGRMTVSEVMRELSCSRSAIYSWLKKFSADGVSSFPGSGKMKEEDEYIRKLERENRQFGKSGPCAHLNPEINHHINPKIIRH